MRHTNASARRKSFFIFLGLFILAAVPLCASIYIYGKVDHVENTYLRSHYERKKVESAASEAYNSAKLNLLFASRELRKHCQDSSGDMMAFITNRGGALRSKMDELDRAILTFKKLQTEEGKTIDEDLVDMAQSLLGSVEELKKVYDTGFEKVKQEQNKLEECKTELNKIRSERN